MANQFENKSLNIILAVVIFSQIGTTLILIAIPRFIEIGSFGIGLAALFTIVIPILILFLLFNLCRKIMKG